MSRRKVSIAEQYARAEERIQRARLAQATQRLAYMKRVLRRLARMARASVRRAQRDERRRVMLELRTWRGGAWVGGV